MIRDDEHAVLRLEERGIQFPTGHSKVRVTAHRGWNPGVPPPGGKRFAAGGRGATTCEDGWVSECRRTAASAPAARVQPCSPYLESGHSLEEPPARGEKRGFSGWKPNALTPWSAVGIVVKGSNRSRRAAKS